MSPPRRIERVEGRGIPLRGHDIDTDRVIPARYLRTVSFEGLERHVFADDRAQWRATGRHPFDDPAYGGAAVLVVNRNFGCGSSREHAPQALQRWGIEAIVGESFSEIFFGNAVALGLPCVIVAPGDAAWLQDLIEASPAIRLAVSLQTGEVEAGGRTCPAHMPEAARHALLTGAWDATGLLLEPVDRVAAVARSLPYISGF